MRQGLRVVMWGVVLCTGMLLWDVRVSTAQTVDEIAAQHIAATGGAEKWRQIKTMTAKATLTGDIMQIPGQPEISADITVLHALGFRQDMRIDIKEMNMTVKIGVRISPDTGGWQVVENPGSGREVNSISKKVYKSPPFLAYQIQLQPLLLDYADKGYSFTLKDKKEKLDKLKLYVIEGQLKEGDSVTLYIDTKKHYLRKLVKNSPTVGKVVYRYEDFRDVDGYVLPFKESLTAEGGPGPTLEGTYTYAEKAVNVPVDEAVFEPDEE